MNKLIVLIVLSSVSLCSFAQRTTGDGGGEAEMTLLKQFEYLPLWLRFCENNSEKCIASSNSRDLINQINNTKNNFRITRLQFVNAADYKLALEKDGSENQLILTHESLYFQDVPKESNELFKLMLNQILRIQSNKSILTSDIVLLPLGYTHPNKLISVLEAQNQDYVLTLYNQQNIHAELFERNGVKNYKIISKTSSGYLILDLDTQISYELNVKLVYLNVIMDLIMVDLYY